VRRRERFTRGLARLAMRVFFSEVEVIGAENVPAQGPLIVVGNHQNSLIDPALMTGFLPRHPRLLAKSTLWEVPFTRWLVRFAGAIPVYRRQDNVDVSRNAEMFARTHEEMFAGGAIALFPEGISHDEPALQTLKTGAARIVLESQAKRPDLKVRVVPVGLIFDGRSRFRSRALLQIGPPLEVTEEPSTYAGDPRGAVRELTARIEAALEEVTLNYKSWEQERLIRRVAELTAHEARGDGRPVTLSDRARQQQAFVDGYRRILGLAPERVDALAARVRRYDRLLGICGLADHQVTAQERRGRALWFLARFAAFALLGSVAITAGVLLNYLPYRVCGWAGGRARNRDMIATVKVVTGLFLFPAVWIAEAAAAAWWGGWPYALGMLALAPATGLVALEGHDRRQRFFAEARAWLFLRTQSRLAADLRLQRRAILAEVRRLAGLLRAERAER